MRAADVMTIRVITVHADANVSEVARLMSKNGISAVPVVDADQNVIGIVSEGDLLRRVETGTERRHGRWLRVFADPETLVAEYLKAHGRRAAQVMTREVVTVRMDTPLSEIVNLFERHGIKRVPVVRDDGRLVGIVSRANLVRALAAAPSARPEIAADDDAIQAQLADELARTGFANVRDLNVIVSEGTVHLWGHYDSVNERKAINVAAEGIPGVRAVVDHLNPRPMVLYQA
jgi:CBS domain-containing protein